jgi:hypothetical protein
MLEIAGSDTPRVQRLVTRAAPLILAEAPGREVLVAAVMFAESGYRPDAVSAKGAQGLMQVMPEGWARTVCRDLAWTTSPRLNVRCGVRLLAEGLRRCGDVPGALTWYWTGARCGASVYSRLVAALLVRLEPADSSAK